MIKKLYKNYIYSLNGLKVVFKENSFIFVIKFLGVRKGSDTLAYSQVFTSNSIANVDKSVAALAVLKFTHKHSTHFRVVFSIKAHEIKCFGNLVNCSLTLFLLKSFFIFFTWGERCKFWS